MFTITNNITTKTFETFAACKAYTRNEKIDAIVFSHNTGKYCYIFSNSQHFSTSPWYIYDTEAFQPGFLINAYNAFLAAKAS